MARLRREHHRLLGNGHCTRPARARLHLRTICATCTFFQTTGPEFLPVLTAQRDDAATKGHTSRADLFNRLLQQATQQDAS